METDNTIGHGSVGQQPQNELPITVRTPLSWLHRFAIRFSLPLLRFLRLFAAISSPFVALFLGVDILRRSA